MLKATLIAVTCALFGVGALVGQDPKGAAPSSPGAQSWTGLLADAACKSATPAGDCEVSTSTASFGIITSDGKFLKFDAKGNKEAKSEIQKAHKTGKVSASVRGTLDGSDTIHVENLSLS